MDNKEETKEEKKDVAKDTKAKKGKKEKRVIVDFDKIDITTATDDDIIRSGLKKNVKFDFICYGIMVIIIVLMLLPPILRKVIPKPITEEVREIAYVTLSCSRSFQRDGYILSTKIVSKFRDSNVLNSVIKYTPSKSDQTAPDDYVFAEITAMSNLNFSGIKSSKDGDSYVFDIDFTKESDAMFNNDVLKDYMYPVSAEIKFLTDSGFYCSQEVENIEERVYIDTGEKVED